MIDVWDRRVLWAEQLHSCATFRVKNWDKQQELLKWMRTNTGGKFYVGGGFVSFNDERDVIMFKLSSHYDPNRNKE